MLVVLLLEDFVFEELSDNVRNLDLEDINNFLELKDNNFLIKEIKCGSLVIIFIVKND